MEEISIRTEFIKLDALLKYAGLSGTGGEAKYVISEGMVKLNDEPCLVKGKKVYPGDVVEFEGQKIRVVNEN
jgi:Uncharacterized conserved protein